MAKNEIGQVSGHYAGGVTRSGAFIIDWFFMLAVYGLILGALQFLAGTFLNQEISYSEGSLVWLAGFLVFAFFYLAVSLTITGKTIGKALVGLRVVTREGAPLTASRAAGRVIVFPLSFLPLGLGLIGILVGRERRALHDVIAKTAVVYDWGDRPASLPAPMTRWLQRRGVEVLPAADDADQQIGSEPAAG
ncbi:MAG TPA: RDD family protein [Acidimicrobiia bacterium]|nr:RDD family protein [Acidimicrobiia bacterium]